METPAFIYKLTPYSDSSAVASAFTYDYGKLKLFVKNAYSNKGAVLCNAIGNLSFSFKGNSELHRFYSFTVSSEHSKRLKNQDILLRMSVCFDLYEHLFAPQEQCEAFWKLLMKFDEKNFREIFIYTFYRLLREGGLWFFNSCRCGSMEGNLYLYKGELLCKNCQKEAKKEDGIVIVHELACVFKSFADNELYRNVALTEESEERILNVLAEFAQRELSSPLKSINVLKACQPTVCAFLR